MKPRDPAFDRACPACDAPPGEGCRDDDGVPQPMTSMHFWRAMGKEKAQLRHTGHFDADGGGIFEALDGE
jgi:hypothetical protein